VNRVEYRLYIGDKEVKRERYLSLI